jgi:hypothetical protein
MTSGLSWPVLAPIVLLSLSNVFMTFAWYGHLKFPQAQLWLVITAIWGIAFFEYCLAVPGNRIGHAAWTAAELKTAYRDRGLFDDKLVCSATPPSQLELQKVLRFFSVLCEMRSASECAARAVGPQRLRRLVRCARSDRARHAATAG